MKPFKMICRIPISSPSPNSPFLPSFLLSFLSFFLSSFFLSLFLYLFIYLSIHPSIYQLPAICSYGEISTYYFICYGSNEVAPCFLVSTHLSRSRDKLFENRCSQMCYDDSLFAAILLGRTFPTWYVHL